MGQMPSRDSELPSSPVGSPNEVLQLRPFEEPPIHFLPLDIPYHYSIRDIEEEAKGYYSDDDWAAMSNYQRAFILTKAVEYRNVNKTTSLGGGKLEPPVNMETSNQYGAIINEEGVESWPGAAVGLQFDRKKLEQYRDAIHKARFDILAQRQWGDRFYNGRFAMGQVKSP
jgi:hypothetical protein